MNKARGLQTALRLCACWVYMPAVYVHTSINHSVDTQQCSQSDTMGLRLNVFCILACLLHTIDAFTPPALAALMPQRRLASRVPAHVVPFADSTAARAGSAFERTLQAAVPFVDSTAARVGSAFERTLQPATLLSLMTTQAVLFQWVLTKSAFGVEVQIADLFSLQKVILRLSVGLCSAFFNSMFNMGKKGAFVVAQVVLAAFVVCAGSNLPVIFTWHAVFERACVYTTALHVPALLKQAKRVAHRVGVYVRTLRKYLCTYRTFA